MYRRYMNVGDVTGALLADTSGNREVSLITTVCSHHHTYYTLTGICSKQKVSEEDKKRTIALADGRTLRL